MSKALSLDLRVRVLAAVAAGLSHPRGCGALRCECGERQPVAPAGAAGGRSRPAGLRAATVARAASRRIALWSSGWSRRARTLPSRELRRLLAGRGLGFGYGTIQRFLMRHGMTRKKKTGHASEQDRPDVLARRRAWRDGQAKLDPARLVFIDETWAKTNMARAYGRAPRGGAPAHGTAARPLEDLDLRCRAHPARHDRALRARSPDQPCRLRDLSREGAGPRAAGGRHRRHGQPVQPQGGRGPPEGSRPPVPNSSSCRPTLPTSTPSKWPSPSSRRCSARPQSAPSRGCGMQSAASARNLQTPGMQKLLRRRRL